MSVTAKHPAYEAAVPAWTLCRDVSGGSRVVKARGITYLPKTPGMDLIDYRNYLQRAHLYGAFGRTVEALTGALFTRRPTVSGGNEILRRQLDDVTMRDESLEDVAREVVSEVLRVGRFALLLDMGEGVGSRPYWVLLPAERVINWRTARVGADPDQLVQAVIEEKHHEPAEDGFGHVERVQYRELALREGTYRARVWTRTPQEHLVVQGAEQWTPGDWIVPHRRGKPLDFIPFTFVGPRGVTPDVARPPLKDLADTVLSHYRNSADHELGLFQTALVTPWASGLVGNEPMRLGPSVCWKLSENGKAGLLEFSGEGLAAIREAMAAKERQMAALGGRLLLEEPHGRAEETATSVRLRYSAESASLRTISDSVSAALTRMARWHAWWIGNGSTVPLEVQVRLTDELFSARATADEIRAALLLLQDEQITYETFYHRLQVGGWTRPGITAAEERAAISREGVLEPDDEPDLDDDALEPQEETMPIPKPYMHPIHIGRNSTALAQVLSDLLEAAYAEDPATDSMLRGVRGVFETAQKAEAEARANTELTEVGKKSAVLRALRTGRRGLASHEARVNSLDAEVRTLREKALVLPPPGPEESHDAEWVMKQLSKMDQLLVETRFIEACALGKNVAILRAVERAKATGFPLISEQALKRGEDLLVKASPDAERIDALEGERDLYKLAVNAARADLEKLGAAHGITPSEIDAD